MGYCGRPFAYSNPDADNKSIGYFSNVYFASKGELFSIAMPYLDDEENGPVYMLMNSNFVYNFMHTLESIEEM